MKPGTGYNEPRVVCLVPVRNGLPYVRGWLESVERFTDAVVALDDGSTDGSAELLEAHPLVNVMLRNPPRDSYRGWDDAANRQRLLDAAAEVHPDWIMFLDVDEQLDAPDARALRRFLTREANPTCAYGMRAFRMQEQPGTYDVVPLWVYRLFAFQPGQRLPSERLHFVPIPVEIPRSRWIRTSLRIQHYASATPARRSARYAKYLEADPDRRFQADYSALLSAPTAIRRWAARGPDQPVLAEVSPISRPAPVAAADAPAISAIVISRNDKECIERAVRAVVEQECPEPFEVIVVTSGTDATADVVRERFPGVRVVDLGPGVLPGAARNAGLLHARGHYVTFPGSHVELQPGSLASRLRAHRQGHAMVTETMLNGTGSCAGWASYFVDNSTVLPRRPSGVLNGPPLRCSYVRTHLFDVGGFREDLRAGEDTVVNAELWLRGHRSVRVRELRVTHHTPCRTVGTLAAHHFTRGRALGRIMVDRVRSKSLTFAALTSARLAVFYVPWRLLFVSRGVHRWGGQLRRVYVRVFPLVVVAVAAAGAGLFFEFLLIAKRALGVAVFRRQRAHLGAAEVGFEVRWHPRERDQASQAHQRVSQSG